MAAEQRLSNPVSCISMSLSWARPPAILSETLTATTVKAMRARRAAAGYAKLDALYADTTIIVTDTIVSYPNTPFSIPESHVEYIVQVDSIGDPLAL